MAGPFDDLIEKYSAPKPAGPFDDLIAKHQFNNDPVAITERIKTDPDFSPTDAQLDLAYSKRRTLPSVSEALGGLKDFALKTIPDLYSKAKQHEAENPLTVGDAAKSIFDRSVTTNPLMRRGLATAGEALLQGTAGLGNMVRGVVNPALDAVANDLVMPYTENPGMQDQMAKQAWLERTRAASDERREMRPYLEGEESIIPGANPGAAQIAANLGADPTLLIPGAKAAGLLKFAKPAARTAATVAAEAAAKGGVARTVAQAAAPAAERAAETVGSVAGKAADVVDKVQPVADTLALVKGGIPAAVTTRVVGTVARKAGKWAEKVSQMGTGLRNIAAADWKSAQPIWQQLAKDIDAPTWLVRASSSSVAPLVESTLRGGAAVGKGAAEGAAIGATATISDDTLSAEERGAAIGAGLGLGSLGAGIGRLASSKSRGMVQQAHDIAVRADKTIKSGVDPAVVLAAPDAVMYYADNIEKLFAGAMPGGKSLEVVLTDNKGAAQYGVEAGASAAYVPTQDNRFLAIINLESPSVIDTRAIHEGLGHALLDSVVGDRPTMMQHIRENFTPDMLQAAEAQYVQAIMPGATPDQMAQYIQAKRDYSKAKYGDEHVWIGEELMAEAAVQSFGGQSILDLGTPSFLAKAVSALSGRRGEVIPAGKDTFFQGSIKDALPALREPLQSSVEQLGAFRPAIDTPAEPGRTVTPKDWGKPHAPLHDLGNGQKGNDFVVQTPGGQVVPRPPAQIKKTASSRRAEVNKAVSPKGPEQLPPRGTPDDLLRLRKTPSGLMERSGRALGDWFYNSTFFGKHTKEFAKQIEQAIRDRTPMAGWYHQIGEANTDWAKSVEADKGNISAQYKDFVPVDFVATKAGNLLVRNYSITAFQRKAQAWAARRGDISLDLWNSDIGAFRQDVETYLKNHEEGRPGADGIGDTKRDVINAFLVGGNRSFEATNPLRSQLRGDLRQGIIRSYRLDRIETLEPSKEVFGKPVYERQLKNLSPEIPASPAVKKTAGDKAYEKAVKSGDMDAAQRLVDIAAKKAGYDSEELAHGTTHKFTVFTLDRANIENDFGKGHYFSNTFDDVSANYAGKGPDLTARIEQMADGLENEGMSREEALKMAEEKLRGSEEGRVIKAYVKLENPAILGGKNETRLDTIFDEEGDSEPTGSGPDFLNAVQEVASEFHDADGAAAVQEILDKYSLLDGEPLRNVLKDLKESEGLAYATDENGALASSEILRQALQRAGYDGIVDRTVNEKFGSQKRIGKPMEGMYEDTYHVIAFDSNQIKSSDPVTYDDAGNVIPLSKRFD